MVGFGADGCVKRGSFVGIERLGSSLLLGKDLESCRVSLGD